MKETTISFIAIGFDLEGDFEALAQKLELLTFFKRTDDWHEKLLKNIDLVGLPRDCHPAKSVLRDKARIGKSYAVDLVLSSGRRLDGQFRPTDILVSDKANGQVIDTDDEHINLLLTLKEFATVTEVRVAKNDRK